MTLKNALPVWYGCNSQRIANAVCSVGSLTQTGLFIPKYKHYEHKNTNNGQWHE